MPNSKHWSWIPDATSTPCSWSGRHQFSKWLIIAGFAARGLTAPEGACGGQACEGHNGGQPSTKRAGSTVIGKWYPLGTTVPSWLGKVSAWRSWNPQGSLCWPKMVMTGRSLSVELIASPIRLKCSPLLSADRISIWSRRRWLRSRYGPRNAFFPARLRWRPMPERVGGHAGQEISGGVQPHHRS